MSKVELLGAREQTLEQGQGLQVQEDWRPSPGQHLWRVPRQQSSNVEERGERGTVPRLSRGSAGALSSETWRWGVKHKRRNLGVCTQVHDELRSLQDAQPRNEGICRQSGLPHLNRTTAAGHNPRVWDPGATTRSLGLLLSCVVLVGVVGAALVAERTDSSRKQGYSFQERSRADTALVPAGPTDEHQGCLCWQGRPGSVLDPCPCHFALGSCKAPSRTSVALLVLCWLCPSREAGAAAPQPRGLPRAGIWCAAGLERAPVPGSHDLFCSFPKGPSSFSGYLEEHAPVSAKIFPICFPAVEQGHPCSWVLLPGFGWQLLPTPTNGDGTDAAAVGCLALPRPPQQRGAL